MPAKSGSGAAVSSGANFQARVAGFLIVQSITCTPAILCTTSISSISFEINEVIDDIAVVDENGIAYIQAKATLSYSKSENSELYDVFKQFTTKHFNNPEKNERYFLVTSNRSPKSITESLRKALDAYRLGEERYLYRDQPRQITSIIDDIKKMLSQIAKSLGRDLEDRDITSILKKMFIAVFDIESEGTLENIVLLLLHKSCYANPRALWGLIISDCIEHASARHTVEMNHFKEKYDKYIKQEESKKIAKYEILSNTLPTAVDVFLFKKISSTGELSNDLFLIGISRFDKNCMETYKIIGDIIEFNNGICGKLLMRTGTFAGMERMLKKNPSIVENKECHIFQNTISENIETTPCANLWRDKLFNTLNSDELFTCIRCGKSVSSYEINVVELPPSSDPLLGFIHDHCIHPTDRVIGLTHNDFGRKHPELRNFDVQIWVETLGMGQACFREIASSFSGENPVIAWQGMTRGKPKGNYLLEAILDNNDTVIFTQKNTVHRFTKSEIDNEIVSLEEQFRNARAQSNPFCYTEESKAFGQLSELNKRYGGKEKIIPISNIRAIPYDRRLAKFYTSSIQYYAPLIYLQDIQTEAPVVFENGIVFLTDPLRLHLFLENWKSIDIALRDFDVAIVKDDADFDSLMVWVTINGLFGLVNPVFDPITRKLESGYRIVAAETIASQSSATHEE